MEGETADGSDSLANEAIVVSDVTQSVAKYIQHFDALVVGRTTAKLNNENENIIAPILQLKKFSIQLKLEKIMSAEILSDRVFPTAQLKRFFVAFCWMKLAFFDNPT